MSNLNELHVPDDADDAMKYAARIELDMRMDSYAQAKLWGVVEKMPTFQCYDPEGEWVLDQMREAYDLSDPKHPEFHSIHADIWDAREGK